MTDSVKVNLFVQPQHLEQTLSILEALNYGFKDQFDVFTPDSGEYCEIGIDSVNFGRMDDVENRLTELGIAHDYTWGYGSTFGRGGVHVRFDQHGELVRHEFYGSDTEPCPEKQMLQEILEIAEKGDLGAVISKIKHEMEQMVVPSWMNQDAFGQLYLNRQKQKHQKPQSKGERLQVASVVMREHLIDQFKDALTQDGIREIIANSEDAPFGFNVLELVADNGEDYFRVLLGINGDQHVAIALDLEQACSPSPHNNIRAIHLVYIANQLDILKTAHDDLLNYVRGLVAQNDPAIMQMINARF